MASPRSPFPSSAFGFIFRINHDQRPAQSSACQPAHAAGEFQAERLRVGTAVYRRVHLAFFPAGFVTFVSFYAVQLLLPEFSKVSASRPPSAAPPTP